MFRRKQHIQQVHVVEAAAETGVAGSNEKTLLPVLTRAEVLATVDVLEEYIELSSDERTTELAGTLIVRLLDRLQTADDAGSPDPALI